MRNIGLVMMNVLLGIITLMVIMTVCGRMNRSMELQNGLSSIVEETVENMMLKKKYSGNNVNEMLADLVCELSVLLETDSDLCVDILQYDKEKGILDVRVTASFAHPNGKRGVVSCERNVIFDKLREEDAKQYTVQFFVEGKLYKAFVVSENDVIHTPKEPTDAEGAFCGWVDEEGYLADFTQTVTQNRNYYADMR